ncbi:MAG: PrsW family intramembrane metalloprotease [Clostridia bacterium]|nr:PrsW family intramembrane metalloprotease [Clostridia bacterium]
MFYFVLSTLMTYNFILMLAAVIPAVFLMIKAYRSDRMEKESPALLWTLVKAGVFSALIALISERALCALLDLFVAKENGWYNVILYFGIVACSEEGAKYFMLKRNTWRSPEFNCQYDGVVYAVFVSLGFALWENISYVIHYGFTTALVRAVTAIPGHACFGVFMGVFYGIAKKYDTWGNRAASTTFRVLAIVLSALLHGAYDYIASTRGGDWYFAGFIAVLFLASYLLVGKTSRKDRYI